MNVLAPAAAAATSILLLPLSAQQPDDDVAPAVAHYARVEQELLARDTSDLGPAQRRARARAIAWLRAYRERAVFGVNTDFPGRRAPYFVDHGGRRCAVAELLDRSGAGPLTLSVAQANNHVWVAELAGHPAFERWLEDAGLTFAEAVRIQAPRPGGGRAPSFAPPPPPEAPAPPTTGGSEEPPAPAPGTPAPRSPSSGPSGRAPGAAPGPATAGPIGPAAAAPGPTTGARRGGIPVVTLGEIDWVTWWRWNRRAFLRPNRLAGPAVGPWTAPRQDGDDGDPDAYRRRAAQALQPLLGEARRDTDTGVRRAALVALGQTAGADAVPALLDALADADGTTRHAALLALGATGSARAAHALLHIARSGSAAGSPSRVGAWAEPLALLALGLARRHGWEAADGPWLRDAAEAGAPAQRDEVQLAALLHAGLAETPYAVVLARRALAPAPSEPSFAVRCRAAEYLGRGNADETLVALTKLAHGNHIELRRSADLGIGVLDSPLAAGTLMTAYEFEKEPMARAFALLSIGRRGGAEARDFLLHHLAHGSKTMRPWAALALGMLLRGAPDAAAAVAIREAHARENNHDLHGAYLIAAGLARDAAAAPWLVGTLHDSKSGLERASAAEGLAMLGGAGARDAVLERFEAETCADTRAMLAEALCYFGVPADVARIAEAMRSEKSPERRAALAAALGCHGTREAHEALRALLADGEAEAMVRAAALEALGLMLAEHEGFALAALGQHTNHEIFPGWLQLALSLTL